MGQLLRRGLRLSRSRCVADNVVARTARRPKPAGAVEAPEATPVAASAMTPATDVLNGNPTYDDSLAAVTRQTAVHAKHLLEHAEQLRELRRQRRELTTLVDQLAHRLTSAEDRRPGRPRDEYFRGRHEVRVEARTAWRHALAGLREILLLPAAVQVRSSLSPEELIRSVLDSVVETLEGPAESALTDSETAARDTHHAERLVQDRKSANYRVRRQTRAAGTK